MVELFLDGGPFMYPILLLLLGGLALVVERFRSLAQSQADSEGFMEAVSKAIKAGGTTLNDYFNAESKPGYFKIQLKVYGRDGQKCSKCESNILKITQSNRSTIFCKESQN